MPTRIVFRAIKVNAAAQNAAVFVGQSNLPGMDASQKQNSAHAPTYGNGNVEIDGLMITDDSQEIIDGVIYDSNYKPVIGRNI